MRRLLGAVFAVTLLATVASAESPWVPPTASPEPTAASAPSAVAGQPPMAPQAAPLNLADYLPAGALDPGEPGREGPRVWGRVEGLMWWSQGSRTPPLVTGGS